MVALITADRLIGNDVAKKCECHINNDKTFSLCVTIQKTGNFAVVVMVKILLLVDI